MNISEDLSHGKQQGCLKARILSCKNIFVFFPDKDLQSGFKLSA